MSPDHPLDLLKSLFQAAVQAADPAVCLPPWLPAPPKGRTVVAAYGKAAASMAKAVEDHWAGPLTGLAVTRYGHGMDCRRIEVIEAGHPMPDAAAGEAARRMLELVSGLGPDDLVLALASGGGSSLLTLPASGLSLQDKQAVTRGLLMSGAPIGQMNRVRRHLSAIKGGRLALAAAPAPVLTFAISDVPGDDATEIASGPTLSDGSTPAEALAILERWKVPVPPAVLAHLKSTDAPPAPGDPRLAHVAAPVLVATSTLVVDKVAALARTRGLEVIVLGDLEGESQAVAAAQARMIEALAPGPPRLILSGGETTVTVEGPAGRGGRDAEFALALAVALDGRAGVYGLACDTDGIDGVSDSAGAVFSPDSLARARALGFDPVVALRGHDAGGLFGALGDLVVTGPTRTNVNDFRAIWVG